MSTAQPSARKSRSPRTRTTRVAWLGHVGLTVDEWVADGTRLGAVSKSTNWWVGDWVRFGTLRYGQRYELASEITGYDEQTLMNMVYVAARFKISRRRENLSWSHHAELAALDEAQQEYWLDRIQTDGLSVRRLRDAIRTDRPSRTAELASGIVSDQPDPKAGGMLAVICPHCGDVFGVRETESCVR